MKIEVKEISDLGIRLALHSQVSFANSIRRILLGEVSSAAIDLLEIKENKTVLADEMLAHRLGLVPIHVTRPLVLKTDCDCDSYCTRCSVVLTLRETNMSDRVLAVTGRSLRPEVPGEAECHDSLLIKLAPGQAVDIKCIVRRGCPTSHAKYCPVTTVGFVYDPQNALRETNLWIEDDLKKEWPMVDQTESREWGDPQLVELDVEVVEGCGKPKEIFVAALEVFKAKMTAILEQL